MKNEALIGLFIISLYVNRYGIPYNFLFFCRKIFINIDLFLNYWNHIMSPEYFTLKDLSEENSIDNSNNINPEQNILPAKYEDKYLDYIRKMDKDFKFDSFEEETKHSKYLEFLKEINEVCSNKINKLNNSIIENNSKLQKFTEYDYCVCEDDEENIEEKQNEEEDDEFLGKTKDEIIHLLTQNKQKLEEELNNLKNQIETEEGKNIIIKKAEEKAYEYIVNLRLEKLKNSYILETTPLGNVLMIYDLKNNTFKYYSDNSIPYRYLETVGRKYVKCFNCRPIFVDMEEELKLAEIKWEKDKLEKEQKEAEDKIKQEELKAKNQSNENKKSVFAKFKSYNKDQGVSKSMVAPPKNSIPNKSLTKEQENEKILLKERANRYTYEGKISNFNFLKKVERKIVDKKYSITFSDFKKMQKKKIN